MEGKGWFPFTSDELQMVLAVFGVAATAATLAELPARSLWLGMLAYFVLAYLAGLLVHARQRQPRVSFLRGGGEGGGGYLDAFRSVRRCLYLMHLDDDPPSAELQGLYRVLLDRGVQIRRTVFVRPEAVPGTFDWIVRFGTHPNLQHRVVLAGSGGVLQLGFVVVDDSTVLISVPGHEAIDGRPYTDRLVFRNLLRIDDREVGSVFQRIHEELWSRALPVTDVTELKHPEQLALSR